MAFPQNVTDDINRGKAYLSDRNVEHISDLKKGCSDCKSNGTCVKRLLRALDFKVELDEYDDIAIGLHTNLILIIGDYVSTIAPKVNAGVDQIINVGDTAVFTATVTPGSASITSIQWTQLLGANTATLSGANTAVLTASNMIIGSYLFQVKVTDANGLIGFDNVVLGVATSVSGINVLTTPAGKYSSADRVSDYSVIITELIGADLSFFIAHRGIGTVPRGSTSPPTDDTSVQVNTTTGLVTFFSPFTDFEEELWFDYKIS